MDWEKLKQINSSLETTNIKGKAYAEVNKRVLAFRELEPNGSIITEILSNDGKVVVMKASVYGNDGKLLGTGHAYEDQDSSKINNTSYIENCETSAVGRALGLCGIGINGAMCSADEYNMAVKKQEMLEKKNTAVMQDPFTEELAQPATGTEKNSFMDLCKTLGKNYREILAQAGVRSLGDMTKADHAKCLLILKEIEESQ